ncbi:hypothetical protein E2320_020709, partial [Naja naja]
MIALHDGESSGRIPAPASQPRTALPWVWFSPLTSNILPHQGRFGLRKDIPTSEPKMFLFTIIMCAFYAVTNAASSSSGTC